MSLAAVLFDNDGLTLDTEPAWTRAEVALFARHGETFTLDHKRDLLGTAPVDAAVKLERDARRPGRRAQRRALRAGARGGGRGRRADAGRRGAAGALRAGGRARSAWSPTRGAGFVERGLRAAGLDGAFAVIVTAEEVARPKPAPDAYVAAAVALGAAPSECAVLEDSPTGLAAGRAAGALTIGVPSFPGVTLDADVVAASLEDPAVWLALGLRGGGRLS